MKNRILNESEHAYMRAYDCLSEICGEFTHENGVEGLKLSELFEFIHTVVNDLPKGLLSELTDKEIVGLGVKLGKRRKIRPAVGAVFAVPLSNGRVCLAVYLGKNTHGYAYGFLHPLLKKETVHRDRLLSDFLRSRVSPLFSAYIVPEPIELGEWKMIAGPEAHVFLKLFPEMPQLYYPKLNQPGYEGIGDFGSAEGPDGKLRAITKTEADLVGLSDETYHQVFFPVQLVKYIERLVGLAACRA